MKKLWLLTLIAFIAPCTTFAQGEVQSSTTTTYWTDGTNGDADGKILNRSKFGDNWFIGIEAGTLFNWGTMQSEHDFIKRFRPMGAVQLGKWMSPSIGARIQGFFGNNSNVAQTTQESTIGTPLAATSMVCSTSPTCSAVTKRAADSI